MDFASSTRAAENMTRWKGIGANLSVMPQGYGIEKNRNRTPVQIRIRLA